MNSDVLSYESRIFELCTELGYAPYFDCAARAKVHVACLPAALVSPLDNQLKDERRAEAKGVLLMSKSAFGCCEALKIELMEAIRKDAQQLLDWFACLSRVVEISSAVISPTSKILTQGEEVGVELKFSFVYNI